MKWLHIVQRPAAGLIVLGLFAALLLLQRPVEEIAIVTPLATLVVQFWFRKAGPEPPA